MSKNKQRLSSGVVDHLNTAISGKATIDYNDVSPNEYPDIYYIIKANVEPNYFCFPIINNQNNGNREVP